MSTNSKRTPGTAAARGIMAALITLALARSAEATPSDVDLAELSLEELSEVEIVYSASRHEQSIEEAPADVTIITRAEIQRHGWQTLAEVLRHVRGYFVTNDRSYAYAGVRGFGRLGDYNSRMLLLMDGHRLNESIYDQAFLGEDLPIDLALVERIEIVRGPASSLYGTSGLFGSINLVTPAAGSDPGNGMNLEAGSNRTARSLFRTSFGSDQRGWMLASLSGFRSDGEDFHFPEYADDPATGGWARGLDGGRLVRAFLRADRGPLRLTAVAHRRRKDVPTAFYETEFGAPGTRLWDSRHFVELAYRRPWTADGETSLRVSYDAYSYDGNFVYQEGDPGEEQRVVYYDRADGAWWTLDLQGNRGLGKRVRGVAGLEARFNTMQDQGSEGPGGPIFDTQTTSALAAVFGQLEWAATSKLRITPGARLDSYRRSATALTPRLVALYNPDPRTRLLGSIGQAFRMPNPFELDYLYIDQKPAPGLERERMRSAEIGIDREILRGLSGHVSGFHYDIEQLIAAEVDSTDGLTVFRNGAELARATGVEVEVKARPAAGWNAALSWSAQRVRVGSADAPPANSPRSVWQGSLSGPLGARGASWAFGAVRVGSRSTLSGGRVDPYILCESMLNGPEWTRHRLRLAVRCTNLLDARTSDPAAAEFLQDSLPGEGRQVSFRAEFRL